jgi:uncharacterized membrane protein
MNSGDVQQRIKEEKETTRVEAFSDGVFAIAITLLVLDLKVPKAESLATGSTLWNYLISQWPVFAAYLVSFCTILIMWVSHHQLFNQIHRTDEAFLFINGFLLLFISITPFPTSLLAEHLQHEFASTAMAIYAGNAFIIAILFNALWRYAAHNNRLLHKHVDAVFVKGVNKQYWIGPPLYFVAFVLAFINVTASILTCALLALFFSFTSFLNRRIFGKT